ncbi:hypothetical protein [Halococcus sp. PRR34]|uniref:hypothetical protein n=1 Tax=Halococcus sp. PRR34 TaxID=3020830 RepID=UPI0023616042|nr:hypothetical protein [Halococcus sp. PRR34]
MAPLQGVILEAGGKRFAMKAEAEITSGVRTGFILDGSGSTWTSIFSSILNSFPGVDVGMREGIHLDLGGGESMVEIEAQSFMGSDMAWGGVSGASPLTQMSVLQQTLRDTQIDSFRPATLEWGEFSGPGQFSPMNVVVESPRITYNTDTPGIIDVSMIALETATFDADAFADAVTRVG